MTEEEIQASVAAHNGRNAHLRQLLSDKAVDLRAEREIDVHFWAWSQRDAAMVAQALFNQGFLLKLLSPAPSTDDPSLWNVEAGARAAPELILGVEFTE